MPKKCGRPSKTAAPMDARQKLIDAVIAIIKRDGSDAVTVRSVVDESGLSIGTFYHHFKNKDDLLMFFVKETSFDSFVLETPLEQFPERICELYFHLIDRYLDMGEDFMKRFYTTGNQALSAYMCEENGRFADGTVMARCEREAEAAISAGILKEGTDAHTLSMDVCTIVKGCVFEWALNGGNMGIHDTLLRIIQRYCSPLLPAS